MKGGRSKKNAESALSRHLTSYLGRNPKKLGLKDMGWAEKEFYDLKTMSDTTLKANNRRYSYGNIQRKPGEEYDPEFDKEAYIEEWRKNK